MHKALACGIAVGTLALASAGGAYSTPSPIVCAAEGTRARFSIALGSTYYSHNAGGITAGEIRSGAVALSGRGVPAAARKVSLGAENIRNQWLRDKRIDLHLYKRVAHGLAVMLTIRTREMGSDDDGDEHGMHQGRYELHLLKVGRNGKARPRPVAAFSGNAVCSAR